MRAISNLVDVLNQGAQLFLNVGFELCVGPQLQVLADAATKPGLESEVQWGRVVLLVEARCGGVVGLGDSAGGVRAETASLHCEAM